MHPSMATANMPKPSSSQPPRERAAAGDRHGRHTNAAAAPRTRPDARVTVDRYMKLMRSTVVERGDRRVEVAGTGAVEHVRPHHHRHGDRHEDPGGSGPLQPSAAEGDEGERPEQVPLLLDGQAPDVAQQRRIPAVVGHAANDLAPVATVEACPRQVAPQLRPLFVAAVEDRPDGDCRQHGEQGRQQSPGATQPELGEVGVAGAVPLVEQERCDEEAGHDEEDLDAEEPAVHPREPGVIEDHGDHRQGPQTVERWLVTHRGHRRHPLRLGRRGTW